MKENASEHDAWIDKVCAHLNKLIQLDFDAAQTYRDALVHVDDPAARIDLESFLGDHERHVMELSQMIRDLGGTPIEAHLDIKGRVLDGITKLRSRSGTLGALRAMRTNEKLTNRVYDRAAEMYMPPIVQSIVMENLADERRHLAAIEAHIDRLSGAPRDEFERAGQERPGDRPYPPV